DCALWDLKAKVLGVSLVDLLGRYRSSILVYGSGGFTSYYIDQLQQQLGGWIQHGFKAVKMKVGRNPDQDIGRVRKAREAIGRDALLFVDANGAFNLKQALQMAKEFSDYEVRWFEEPVTSDNLEGLNYIRENGPAGIQITAGEYGYDQTYFLRMLNASAVDVLQIDATRCAGITGFLQAAALCDAFHIPLSSHTAPSIHAHVCCALRPAIHVEYFHDHERIEHLLFEGALTPVEGKLYPDLTRPGLGLEFVHKNAEPYEVDF
ncbi:MAG TPA: enolase C-terminal domain-like protein, partial [Acidobacteriota bacterium]